MRQERSLLENDAPRDRRRQLLLRNRTSVQGGPAFFAPLTTTLVLARGTGSPTFTRATVATFLDFEGVLRTVPSGAARFPGARMVRNTLTGSSEDLTNGAWTKNGITVSGGLIYPTATGAFKDVTQATTTPTSGQRAWTVTVKASGKTWMMMRNFAGSNGAAWFNLTAGTVGTVVANYSASIAPTAEAGYYKCTLMNTTALTADAAFFGPADGDNNTTATTNGTDGILFLRAQRENVTGQSIQTPGEYVSVGVLAAPYQGAGVDGLQYFDKKLDGTLLSSATMLGYLSEASRTQILATADIRDMTTANWTLGATMTRARTSVGIDGGANLATRLTGGAVAATNTCYTTITAAATSRTYSCYVKRITGTGPVRVVQTGTETDISGSLVANQWVLVQNTGSVLNSVMGIKIDTNGDAVDVDCNQFEAGAVATSRMLATGAVRNADVLTYPLAGNFSDSVGTMYAEVTQTTWASVVGTIIGSATQGMLPQTTNNGVAGFDGTNTVKGTAGAPSGLVKMAVAWTGSTMTVCAGGTAVVSGTYDGTWNLASIGIGTGTNATIKNVRIWPRALSTQELVMQTR